MPSALRPARETAQWLAFCSALNDGHGPLRPGQAAVPERSDGSANDGGAAGGGQPLTLFRGYEGANRCGSAGVRGCRWSTHPQTPAHPTTKQQFIRVGIHPCDRGICSAVGRVRQSLPVPAVTRGPCRDAARRPWASGTVCTAGLSLGLVRDSDFRSSGVRAGQSREPGL